MHAIPLSGTPYALNPDFAACCAIERRLGVAITALAARLADGQMTVEEMAEVFSACLPPEQTLSGDALLDIGLERATALLAQFFTRIFRGRDNSAADAPDREALSKLAARFPDRA